jgi:hypothetical protein
MKPAVRRRRKPRTVIGKVIRAWPKLKLALRVVRFVRRRARAIQVAIVGAVGGLLFSRVRRARRRRESQLPAYSPSPEPTPAGFGGGTRETGYEAGPGTQTERELESEKGSDDDGAGKSPTFEEPPPVEDEPPTKT